MWGEAELKFTVFFIFQRYGRNLMNMKALSLHFIPHLYVCHETRAGSRALLLVFVTFIRPNPENEQFT